MNQHERRARKKVLLISPSPEQMQAGNSYPIMLKLSQKAEPGKVYDTIVRHDKWCDLLADRGACDCTPDVELREREKKK